MRNAAGAPPAPVPWALLAFVGERSFFRGATSPVPLVRHDHWRTQTFTSRLRLNLAKSLRDGYARRPDHLTNLLVRESESGLNLAVVLCAFVRVIAPVLHALLFAIAFPLAQVSTSPLGPAKLPLFILWLADLPFRSSLKYGRSAIRKHCVPAPNLLGSPGRRCGASPERRYFDRSLDKAFLKENLK